MAKKRGLPEDHELEVDLAGVTEAADIPDFLDMDSQPRPVAVLRPAPRVQPDERRSEKEPEEPVRKPQAPAAKRAPQPPKVRRSRPPRKEIGFDDETQAMLKELHQDGVSQSMEESLTRSEVARAAIRAVYMARNLVEYGGIGPRGRWGTPTARALLDDLTENYLRAVGRLYMDRYHTQDE